MDFSFGLSDCGTLSSHVSMGVALGVAGDDVVLDVL